MARLDSVNPTLSLFRLSLWTFVFHLLVGIPSVLAQLSDAICPSSLSFLSNQMGQSPCIMASYLWGAGLNPPATFTLWDLNSNNLAGYPGPTSTNQSDWPANRIECSMPFYNLISACMLCQGKDAASFAQFTASCNSSFTGREGFPVKNLPINVPRGTEIPPWTFIDSSQGSGNWEVNLAQTNITAEASPSSSSSSVASTASSKAHASETATSDNSTSSKDESKSNTGAIVGGVFGGLAVIGLAIGGAFWLRSRQRRGPASALIRDQWNGNGHTELGLDGHISSFAYRSTTTPPQMRQVPNQNLSTTFSSPPSEESRHSLPAPAPAVHLPEIQSDDWSKPDVYPSWKG